MKEILKSKAVVALLVGVALAGLSAVVGYNVQDAICEAPAKVEASKPSAE